MVKYLTTELQNQQVNLTIIKNLNQDTALHSAAANGQFAIVEYLLNTDRTLYKKDSEGKTALQKAIFQSLSIGLYPHGQRMAREIASYLMEVGAGINEDIGKLSDRRRFAYGFYELSYELANILSSITENKVLIAATYSGKPITRQMRGFATAITNFEEFLLSPKALVFDINLLKACEYQ